MLVSLGSAAVLDLKKSKIRSKTDTIYLMNDGGCQYDCSFCSQAKSASTKQKMLSRVSWPEYDWNSVLDSLDSKKTDYKRVCMQVVNTADIFEKLPKITAEIKEKNPQTKIAMTIRTYKMRDIDALFEMGATEVGLSMDAIDPQAFREIKGGDFKFHKDFIVKVAKKYPAKVATHLIVGLGETEQQVVEIMQEFHQLKIIIALFAFTPIRGSKMENMSPPSKDSYRRIQIALELIKKDLAAGIEYDEKGQIASFALSKEQLYEALKDSKVFQTSGCSDCNRPYYNERAGDQDLYNYPFKLNEEQFERVLGTAI